MIWTRAIHIKSSYANLFERKRHCWEKLFETKENKQFICIFLTAIKLLLTDPRPFGAVLKCSMTSQFDFFGVVVVVCDWFIGEFNGGTCNSNDICGDRVWRNDVERLAIPLREFPSFSCNNQKKNEWKYQFWQNNLYKNHSRMRK